MIENLINNLSLYLQGSAILAFVAAYLGGVVISFTPCTYPLIPVTVGIIGAQGASSKLRGFLLSLFYVLGLAVTYAALGAVAALSGRLFGQMQTTPLVYFIMANIFLIMGLSMLDVFKISIPIPQKVMKYSGGKKRICHQFSAGRCLRFRDRPLHSPGTCGFTRLCRFTDQSRDGNRSFVCFCPRYGDAIDSGRHICRVHCITAAVRGLDDCHNKGFWHYFDWRGRIFPIYCRHTVFLRRGVSCVKRSMFSLPYFLY